ncbi:MAG: hypothetical protein MI867_09765 [Pseudomonadales bacterium]|nr:hypothetical protein [Pseudomonadales bacterium]
MSKWLIGVGCLVIALLVALVLVATNKSTTIDTVDTIEAPLNQPEAPKTDVSSVSIPTPPPEPSIIDTHPEKEILTEDLQSADAGAQLKLQQAMQTMRESLEQDDPRTPEMSEPYQRELPTEAELADPALYEAYELRQTKRMAAVYSSVNKEIPAIRNRIDAAKMSGSKSPEEIQEAEDALAKMEELSEMLQIMDPDLEEQLDSELSGSQVSPDMDQPQN